jgi:ADP-L-glycero-D-manno-heptose 6-epimerase
MYGYSKHLFDLWAMNNAVLDRIAGVKFFNVYGPNEYHKGDMRSVIHKAYGQIMETGKLRLFKSYKKEYPDGGQKRDFIYVKDAVNMTLKLYDSGSNGIYNAGTGKARTWVELGNAVFAAMGRKPEIEFIDMPETIRDKYQYFTEAKMEKMSAVYSGKTHSLEEGVGDYVKNYLMQGEKNL